MGILFCTMRTGRRYGGLDRLVGQARRACSAMAISSCMTRTVNPSGGQELLVPGRRSGFRTMGTWSSTIRTAAAFGPDGDAETARLERRQSSLQFVVFAALGFFPVYSKIKSPVPIHEAPPSTVTFPPSDVRQTGADRSVA